MLKKISKFYYLFIWAILIAPSVAFAWVPTDPIVPCGTDGTPDCDFNGLIQLINNLMDFFIWASAPIAMVVFAWVGWTFVVEGDKSGAISKAKERLTTLLKGIFLILSAWLIVKLILVTLVDPEVLKDIPIEGLN